MTDIDKQANVVDGEEAAKAFRHSAKMAYKVNSKTPTLARYVTNANIRYAHAALKFASVCLSNYKSK